MRGSGSERNSSVSGDPGTGLLPENESLTKGIRLAQQRDRAGLKLKDIVAFGEISAPIVIIGCHRQLAAAECAGKHGIRRHLGVNPPQRRSRNRSVHAGYDEAIEVADRLYVRIPIRKGSPSEDRP